MDSLNTTTKTRVKPTTYNAISFHGVRFISAACCIIVGSILAFFAVALKNDGYKIPWTFLIGILAAALTLICLLLTLCIHTCMRLSPIFNLLLNVPLLILWIVVCGLLGWNVYGTLAHSCTLANWGNNDGMMICQQYKALFSFVVFATLSQIATIVVDVRARLAQNRSGKYAAMRDSTSQLKLEPYDNSHNQLNSVPTSTYPEPHPQRRETFEEHHEQFRQNYEYRDHDDQPGWRPGQRTNTTAAQPYAAAAVARTNTTVSSAYSQGPQRTNTTISSNYGEVPHRNNTVASSHYSETPYNQAPHRNNTVASSHYSDDIGQQQMRMHQFDNDYYQRPSQGTGYDNMYGQQHGQYNQRY